MMMSVLILFFLVIFSYWLFGKMKKPKDFPPGPARLPFVGSFPFLTGSGPKPSLLRGLTEQVKF